MDHLDKWIGKLEHGQKLTEDELGDLCEHAWIEPRFAIPEFTTEEKHIVAELKVEKTRLSPCLYMQLQLCSRTLRDFLVDHNSTAVLRVRVWNQIIEGLCHIHSQNVVHLDLHRGNILVDSEDNAVIADFGLARRLNVDRPIPLKPGTSDSSEYWMSPEVKGGREDISTAADVFSLGFICYELFQPQEVMNQKFFKDVEKLKSGYILQDWGTGFTRVGPTGARATDVITVDSTIYISSINFVESYVITVPKAARRVSSSSLRRNLLLPTLKKI